MDADRLPKTPAHKIVVTLDDVTRVTVPARPAIGPEVRLRLQDGLTQTSEDTPHLDKVWQWCRTWWYVVIPVVVVAGIGCFFLVRGGVDPPVRPGGDVGHLIVGHDYWIAATTVEVLPDDDSADAPDIYYTVEWQDKQIFRSDTKRQTLVASFSIIGVDVIDAVLGGRLSVDKVINAALINYSSNTRFTIRVFGDGFLWDEKLGGWSFNLAQLTVGDNVFERESDDSGRIDRIVVRVADKATPIGELMKMLSQL